jgi:hypothetical protein
MLVIVLLQEFNKKIINNLSKHSGDKFIVNTNILNYYIIFE